MIMVNESTDVIQCTHIAVTIQSSITCDNIVYKVRHNINVSIIITQYNTIQYNTAQYNTIKHNTK